MTQLPEGYDKKYAALDKKIAALDKRKGTYDRLLCGL